MNDQPEKNKYGTVTVAAGTRDAHDLAVTDHLRATYADHRLISIVGVEGGSVIVSVENPASTGRNTKNQMWLSPESLSGILTTALLYFSAKGVNIMEMATKTAKDDTISYSMTDNLQPPTLK